MFQRRGGVIPQLEKLLNIDLLSFSSRMVFQLEEIEGIGKEKLKPKISDEAKRLI